MKQQAIYIVSLILRLAVIVAALAVCFGNLLLFEIRTACGLALGALVILEMLNDRRIYWLEEKSSRAAPDTYMGSRGGRY